MNDRSENQESNNLQKTGKFGFGYILIAFLCILLIYLTYVGFTSMQEHDFQNRTIIDILTQPILANKGYTFVGTLTDFDRQLADFYYNNIFSLLLAGVILKYDVSKKFYAKNNPVNSKNDVENGEVSGNGVIGENGKNRGLTQEKLKKIITILAAITITYFVMVLIFSTLNVGWSFITNNGRNILLYDYYDLYFASKLIPFLLLFIGGANTWYLLFRRHFRSDYVSNPTGVYFIIAAFVLFNIRLITRPLDTEHIINNMTLITIIIQFLQLLIILGIMFILQSKIAAYVTGSKGSKDFTLFKNHNKKMNLKFWLNFVISFGALVIIVAIFIIEEPWVSINIGHVFLAIPNLIISTILTCLYYYLGLLLEIKYGKNNVPVVNSKSEELKEEGGVNRE